MVERGGVNDGGTENDRTPRPEVPEEVENERVRRFLSDLHRPRDALAVLRFVLRHPDGVPIPVVTEETLGETPTGRNDRFIRRLIERNPRFFETDRSQAVYVVAPSPDALNLITGRQISKPPEGTVFDKDTARALLNDQKMLNENGRQIVLDRFGSYIDRVSQKEVVLRDLTARGEEYAVIPYRTRFTDDARQDEQWAKFHYAWETASREYDNACFMTLTTDPKMHDGLLDSWENISDSFNRLMSFLSTDSRLGYRPDYVAVLEPSDRGLPHLHVALFGVAPADIPSQEEIRAYWDGTRDVGSQVHVAPLRLRNNSWLLRSEEAGDAGDVSLSYYLTEAMRDLVTVAESDADDLLEAADEGDVSLWKQALYWYTERQYYTASPSLKPDDTDEGDDDSLPYVPTWEYVGTFREENIPARFLRNRVRPPPSEPPPS